MANNVGAMKVARTLLSRTAVASLRAARGTRVRPLRGGPRRHNKKHSDRRRRWLSDSSDGRKTQVKRELAILAQAFRRYDGDHSGALDKGEVEKALEDLDIPNDGIFVDSLFAQLDKNKDGTVELQEWLENLPRGTRIRIISKFDESPGKENKGSALDDYRAVRLEVPTAQIVYTYTDEAPMFATHSLLPICRAMVEPSGIKLVMADISLAGRILANFPDALTEDQRVPDELARLGQLAKSPEANIIKLPNISASEPQLRAAIAELRAKGYDVPEYPNPDTAITKRYAKVLGSAVNPVLREGNSDRRVAAPVKAYAKANPHKMGTWAPSSKSHVAYMDDGDFYSSEQSVVIPAALGDSKDSGVVKIEFIPTDGGPVEVLKAKTKLEPREIIDASRLSVAKLREFYRKEMDDAKAQGVLFSLHLKATMMKVSDPIMFGHAVETYYRDTFATHAETFRRIGVNTKNGLGDVYARLDQISEPERGQVVAELEANLAKCETERPKLAMVDSDKGITNLHVPSDVIIDASVPAAIRESGKMWGPDGELHDAKFVIPDRCYATSYAEVFKHCVKHGAFDPTTMGCVSNVGLMAQKAEEYGSHDKTFEAPAEGLIRVVERATKETLMEHAVEPGDVWRMCQTKDSPVMDWVKLAVARARATGNPAIFWLDPKRPHDANLIQKVETYLQEHDTKGLDISILPPRDAMRLTLERCRAGDDTISVTGNVLRDYLTDLFPILELGTSAKMLSIVPLLAGGGLFETGAGGSAPKHVQQLQAQNHLRWDSLGEFLALAVSLEDIANKTRNAKAAIVASCLTEATAELLTKNKSPGRKPGLIDNRGSHFYLGLYWAEALAKQTADAQLAETYAPLAKDLRDNEATILTEIAAGAKTPADTGGYYKPDPAKADMVMRPSKTLNAIVDKVLNANA